MATYLATVELAKWLGVRNALPSIAHSPIHGVDHWDTVAANAKKLVARMQTGANLNVCVWFAYLHDCQRVNEHHDPQHGERAAALIQRLWEEGYVTLTHDDMEQAREAIKLHHRGVTKGPLIQRICWDADRLHLVRVGTRPDPDLMCTTLGKKMARELPKVHREVFTAPQFGRKW